jgi:hypothetical protein
MWSDGSYYFGEVVNGKREGQGEYYSANDKSSYKGCWKAGLKQGKGTLTFSNGSAYEGEFENGLREGQGKMKYPSGNEYEGSWKKDKKEGQGTMHWISAFEKYEGMWSNDLPEGQGTYYWLENRTETKTIKTIYRGEWKQGRREGYGAFFYNNGCRMEGTFTNNLKEGLCAITDEFGDTHIEHFLNDKSADKENQLKSEQRQFKLPDLHKPIIHNNEPTDNIYTKIIDIPSKLIDESICNLLLRENSHLRSEYKALISSTNREIFNGLNIEGLWRLVKDMKITNEWLTLAKLNRLFCQGHKSQFGIEIPKQKKLEMLESHPNSLVEYPYQELEWHLTFEEFKKMPLDWEQWPKAASSPFSEINLKKVLEVHEKDHIILYRHFVVYLLRIALLQH